MNLNKNIFHFLLSAFLLSPFLVFSQSKGYSNINDTRVLQKKLMENASQINTISSDFIQEKNMKMLEEKVISKGKFYYKKEDKIRIEYLQPFHYLLIISGGSITVKDESKSNKINTKNSKSMQSVNKVMMDCMRGTVFNNKDFKVNTFESGKNYLLSLEPLDAGMKRMFSTINVVIDKGDLKVSELIMKENNGDQTMMKFSNIQNNPRLADALFSPR